MNSIYLDYNATTPIAPEVAECMKPFLNKYFGNPSSSHQYGIETKKAIQTARKQVAFLLEADPEEIIFTSGGTESNNLALQGVVFANRDKGNHIITTKIEHPAISEVCRYLERNGYSVSYSNVDQYGIVSPEVIRKQIHKDTILISVMHANNETGSIQDIQTIAEIAKEHGIVFHTDAAQSVGKIELSVKKTPVDLISIAGHKLYAPKGIGALYIRKGVRLEKIFHGADHEQGLRPGTENVLEIIGLGKACEIAARDLKKNKLHFLNLRDSLHTELKKAIPEIRLNGHAERRLSNTLNISFPRIEATTLLSELSGIAASAGAACHADSIDVSHVLKAMNVPEEYSMGSIRFSVGRNTTAADIEEAVRQIKEAVSGLMPRTNTPELKNPSGTDIKLTQYTHGLGCACKLRPQDLEQILAKLPVYEDKNVLVGIANNDDAAVYRINKDTAIVQTLDFFTPIVDDPYDFGAIAAANALSDIYAMGARPLFALNIVGFPSKRLPFHVLEEILKGASDKAKEAGIAVLGGHTVDDTEPKYGMAVTGIVHPSKIFTNKGAQPGDALLLTKAIGTGILSTAAKQGLLEESTYQKLVGSMSSLNKTAADILNAYPVNACTDITGFGLLGHLKEMTVASSVNAILSCENIPILPEVYILAAEGIIPGGTKNNHAFSSRHTRWNDTIPQTLQWILCDAQTSGGLLIALPEKNSTELLDDFKRNGISEAAIIGGISQKGIGIIEVNA